jgi:HK97 gp10 family phage protein
MARIVVVGVTETIAMFGRAAAAGEAAKERAQAHLAQDVAQGAQAMAPVDTGALRESIQAGPDNVTVGVPYAGFVEYGTVNMPPEPYLRPAADTVDTTAAMDEAAAIIQAV